MKPRRNGIKCFTLSHNKYLQALRERNHAFVTHPSKVGVANTNQLGKKLNIFIVYLTKK